MIQVGGNSSGQYGSCQVVTGFLSGDPLEQGFHRADRLTEYTDTVNLTRIPFVFEKTPIMFSIKHLKHRRQGRGTFL